MIRWRRRLRQELYIIIDSLGIFLAYLVALHTYREQLGNAINLSSLETVGLIVLLHFGFIGIFIALDIYDEIMKQRSFLARQLQIKTLLAFATGTAVCASLLYLMNSPVEPGFILIFSLIYLGFCIISKTLLFNVLKASGSSNKVDCNILIVGCSAKGRRYIDEIKRYEHLNLKIAGYVEIHESDGYEGLRRLGGIDNLTSIARENRIDEIAVALPLNSDMRLKDILDECQDIGITITMILECQNSPDSKTQVSMVGDVPVLKFHTVSLNENQLFAKRVLDVCGALVGMVIFGIAFIVMGPLIKLETRGPVLFKQQRVGRNGRVFEIWKFRSMGVNAEAQQSVLMACNEMSGHMFKVANDPRVTRIGAFMRKTSIDELPQFYNVLKQDMSLVGTRPPTVQEVKQYEHHHQRRISITPGITGMWQISGRSDITDFEEVVKLDNEYIQNWTIWSDIVILFKTLAVVAIGKGSR